MENEPVTQGEGAVERLWRTSGVADVMDPDGLARWRASANEGNGHDMCGANNNSLRRLVATIDALAAEVDETRQQARIAALEEAAKAKQAEWEGPAYEFGVAWGPDQGGASEEVEQRARALLIEACRHWGHEPPPGHMLLAPFTEAAVPWLVGLSAIRAALTKVVVS